MKYERRQYPDGSNINMRQAEGRLKEERHSQWTPGIGAIYDMYVEGNVNVSHANTDQRSIGRS